MRTTISLENMEFRAFHGCYDLEKKVGNNFSVDLYVDAEIGDAAQCDDIKGTVSYLTLFEIVELQMKQTSDIIENVAYRIIDAIYKSFPNICSVKITVSKLAPPLGGKIARASVTISR